ncbi:hypothetical protein BCR41DRAFT_354194 [Lobosporangium transversale]|uniref:Uncharacterized protein n=1 Tax=Lobosporangium transversale TaxID=64571 RepID=A0A1Y2GLK8_9FUNG|nr:hypothetical protein BCR41DRAFT_354194 [Lobosporangium transversale]ORZ14845.1 hypothetical protein BCR41DRAFT_354194 [Lobosporangium transversale]|eukprot:XP_021880977.1 hypothetical protein BCR41DRAFT_354194 [Lobosporangium transversale]
MERANSDYLSVSDLSKPRQTPLQIQLQKIDPSIIKNGTPSSGSHRRGHARQKTTQDFSLFETTVLAFRNIIFNRLWKHDHRFQNETDFCKQQWDIHKSRKATLIECAELLLELSTIPIRPCTEQVCTALVQAFIHLQPSTLHRTSGALELWQRVLDAWRAHHGLKLGDPIHVENMSADFVSSVLLPQIPTQISPTATNVHSNLQGSAILAPQQQSHLLGAPNHPPPYSQLQIQIQPSPPPSLQQANSSLDNASTISAESSINGLDPNAVSSVSSTAESSSATPFRKRIAHLLTDERRFHAPKPILERVNRFFRGPPQLDPAAFEGTNLDATIAVPFPDIMDTDGWRIPIPDLNGQPNASPQLAPIQSCFLHVPILPSKRRLETETEVILLDDVRLAGQLNAKLWEEFSNGNVVEAISIVPTSATWFSKTAMADWPCVVMTGLKFEQANFTDTSGKKFSEAHSYIAVFLGHDPIRQTQFVQTFQDLGISAAQNPEILSIGRGEPQLTKNNSGRSEDQHRWIAGFRRLFRTQGIGGSKGRLRRDPWNPTNDTGDNDLIDPQFDDIYSISIQPPAKKPRLERVGRPSDAQAAWHHSKRRKMDEIEFSKLKNPDLSERMLWSDDDMSE